MRGSPRKPTATLLGVPTRSALLDSTPRRRRNSLLDASYTGSTEHLTRLLSAPDKVIAQERVRPIGVPQSELALVGNARPLQARAATDRIDSAARRIVSPDQGWTSLPRVAARQMGAEGGGPGARAYPTAG